MSSPQYWWRSNAVGSTVVEGLQSRGKTLLPVLRWLWSGWMVRFRVVTGPESSKLARGILHTDGCGFILQTATIDYLIDQHPTEDGGLYLIIKEATAQSKQSVSGIISDVWPEFPVGDEVDSL